MTRITTIGILTADRPAVLRRSLESLVRHCDEHGHRPRFLVIDGSRRPASLAETRSAVASLAAANKNVHELEYVGPAEAARVRASLCPDAVIAPLLSPGAIGASRNLMLLLTAGEQMVSVDDDIVCETWTLPSREDGLAVMGHHQELLETAFFSNRAEALAAVAQTPVDLLAAHGALLGLPLPALIAASPRPADLTRGSRHLHAALRGGRPLVVKATFAGLAGDAATYCPHRLLFSAGPLRARLWSSRATFETAMTSREAFRIAATNVVTHDCGCMAGCMGLSNEMILPPFMPAGGNEDGVFGAMLTACDPATLFAHLPVGVVHDSDRPPERDGPPMRSARESRVSELIIALVLGEVSSWKAQPCDDRMQRMSRLLMGVGELGSAAFIDLVTQITLQARLRELGLAERALEQPACPEYWRAAVVAYRRDCLTSMTRRDFFLPVEFHGVDSIEAGYLALQAFLANLGRLIASWPALWETARALNAGRRAV